MIEIDAANASIPERDIVSMSDSAMTAAAAARSDTRLASGDDHQRTRYRQSVATRGATRAAFAHRSPNVSGNAISIQPAKWFLLTNGPKGLPAMIGVQKP